MKNILIGAKKILKKANRYRVPHCSSCERCQCTDFVYKDYYCCEENDTMQRFRSLGVDHPPKTSPKWCPKRAKKGGE